MKILLSYDGHESSKKVLEFAQKHAIAFHAQLDVVTVVTRESNDQHEDIEEAEKILEKAMRSCKKKEIDCETKLLIKEGTPGEALIMHANENDYDQIIIGIRRTSQLSKMLLGSNAQYVILNAQCPVLSINKNV